MEYDNIMTIIVISCDAYLDIAENYVNLFRQNWSDCPYRLLVAFEQGKLDNYAADSISCGANTTWTQRAIMAISNTTSPYILLSVDDLFISKRVDSVEIQSVLDFIKREMIKYYRIPVFKINSKNVITHPRNESVELIPSHTRYNVSIGTAIWDRIELLNILGDGTKSAWDLENYFLEQSQNSQPGFLDKYVSDKRFLLKSIHMIKSGKWIPKSAKELSKLGYSIDYLPRGYISLFDQIRLNRIYSWASRKFPIRLRAFAKKLLSLIGFKFTSMK